MTHTWADRKADGDKYEEEQDAWWKQYYRIERVDETTDRRGVDRVFYALKAPPLSCKMQYKGDRRAHETGKLFMEVVSNVGCGTPGGALACAADVMSIYVPAEKVFYWLSVPMLRVMLHVWIMQYPMGTAENCGYETKGVLVPRDAVSLSMACVRMFAVGNS